MFLFSVLDIAARPVVYHSTAYCTSLEFFCTLTPDSLLHVVSFIYVAACFYTVYLILTPSFISHKGESETILISFLVNCSSVLILADNFSVRYIAIS